MHPGPAPRPPTDRPRLNLTPQVSNVAGNMSAMSLHSGSPNTSSASLNRSMTSFDQLGSETNIIKEGWSKVKEEGGFMKGVFWSDKYLVLREKQLDFLKNNTTSKVSSTIPLKDVMNITRSDTHAFAFELIRGVGASSASSPARDSPQKLLICRFETDNDVYAWIDAIYDRCPSMGGVSHPTGFTHRVHVGFDPVNGGFTGLPPEWQRLLNSSALTKDDMAKNPEAVVEALKFYHDTLQKRADDPRTYPSTTPTPSIESANNKQLAYGGGGMSIAPPRPQPPGFSRQDSYSRSQSASPASQLPLQRVATDPRLQQDHGRPEDERRRQVDEDQRRRNQALDRQRDQERREKQELDEYNASLPKQKVPLAQQELGGYGAETPNNPSRYNATRPAPPAPTPSRDGQGQRTPGPAPVRQLAAQRAAPSPPSQNGMTKSPSGNQIPNGTRAGTPEVRKPATPNGQAGQPNVKMPTGAQGQVSPKSGQPGSHVKPLNVAAKPPTGAPMDPIKKAELALTSKPKEETPKKEQRMSSMTDAQVMERLRDVVSKDKPLDSYNKQKKIGQGASGSVYVARIRESAPSPTAKMLLREHGPRAQVAIKQMDLRNQPRKELIVNEIIVMKDSKHPNIVNFLDAFLQEESSELWVVMEFMEGGALTDVIDNNPSISEDQIATICLEVRHSFFSCSAFAVLLCLRDCPPNSLADIALCFY